MDDLVRLPYIRCVVKETLRWFPTGINGALPHAARNNDEIDGYHIPAGAGIVLAVWAANNDDELFPRPREFDPSRHMRNADLSAIEAAQASDTKDRDHWSFGSGRRICPGMHLAERTLSLAIMRILWAFEISKEKDENGEEVWIEPDEVTQAIAACPLPFR
jgi:cytochrome P450